jgi:hypothetical protein
MTGRTTQEIARAGNIRADMFQLLLTADIVVADISIHNANVFYELGVRHALRDRRTLLLRAAIDEVPFDLKTDRYLSYEPGNPAASLDLLVNALAETRRSSTVDSPVYSMLPGLSAPDPSAFVIVPQSFREEVNHARLSGTKGDLRFLASELSGLPWRREGLRLVGEAQFQVRDLRYAAESWEAVRSELPNDVGANQRLGTIYQKLKDLVRSDAALERVIATKGLGSGDLAEARALSGSNAKTRWLRDWGGREPLEQRQAEALRSPFLIESLEEYRKGFETDPSHFYSGLNALAMTTVLTELAGAQPSVWQERFEDEDTPGVQLRQYTQLRSQLSGAVEFSLRACKQRLEREETSDPWLALSLADYAFLLSKANAPQLYRDAFRRLEAFALTVARNQFDVFKSLGVLPKTVGAVEALFASKAEPPKAAARPKALLFTGHRIDDPNRTSPRFPAGQEPAARQAILETVQRDLPGDGRPVIAIAGGASGGDLLFQEICEKLGVERHLYLIIPRDDYVVASVAPAGPDWVQRFNHQFDTATCRRVYQDAKGLPDWLADKPDYGVWQRSNIWMLHNALSIGDADTTLIALWDGKGGDGPGGTEHMVRSVLERGARAITLDTKQLFGL